MMQGENPRQFIEKDGTKMNQTVYPLNELPEGQTARVAKIQTAGSMRRRLQELGMIEGTAVCCLQKSPSGDPIAFLIRGAAIALRNEDSRKIFVC